MAQKIIVALEDDLDGGPAGRPGNCCAPTDRADLMSGMPLLVEEVSGCAAVAWHLHLSLEGAKRSGFGRELIALGACEFTGGRLVWSGTAGAGGCWAERLVRCGFC